MCAACSEDARWAKCPGCREQEGTLQFPLTRSTWNFSNLWEHCASLFKPQWLMFSLAALIALVVSYAGAIPGSVAQLAFQAGGMDELMAVALSIPISLLGTLVQLVLALGLVRVSLDVLQGGTVELGRLFSQFRRLPAILGLSGVLLAGFLVLALGVGAVAGLAGMAASLVVGGPLIDTDLMAPFALGGLLLALPLVVVASLAFYLALIGLVVEPEVGALAQLSRTWAALRGQKLASLGLTLLLGLLMTGGVMLCCVGYLPAYAFTMLVMTGLYLALQNDDRPVA